MLKKIKLSYKGLAKTLNGDFRPCSLLEKLEKLITWYRSSKNNLGGDCGIQCKLSSLDWLVFYLTSINVL